MMKLKSLFAGLALATLSLAPALSQGVGQLGSGQLFANPTASPARGIPTSPTALLDFAFGSTRGAILKRGASAWTITVPSVTAGLPWVSNGTGADPAYQLLGIVGGGTNCGAASGTCLDNITGFSSTGYVKRTGAGTYVLDVGTGSPGVLEKGAAYTAVTADCGSTVTLGGGSQYTLTLNAASGYAATCGFTVINLSTETRTKTIAASGLTSFYLYPGQSVVITNQSNVWNVSATAGRWRLTAATTFFVRPDGADTNDGLANSSAGAFLTPNAAFASVSANIDMNGQSMTVQHTCASPPCTITANAQMLGIANTRFTGGIPTYAGDCTTPSNVTLAPAAAGLIADIRISLNDYMFVCGFKLAGGANGPIGMYISGGQWVNITGPMIFDNVGVGMQVNSAARVYIDGGLTISHSMTTGFQVSRGAYIEAGQAETITLSGTPAFSFAFIQVFLGGNFNLSGLSYSGTATGLSASVTYLGILDSTGGGCTGLPGNGTVSTSNGGVCF